LPRVDGSLRSSRRFAALVEMYAKEAGGVLSETDQNLAQQAASMTLAAEMLTADVVAGRPVDHDDLVRVNSECRRLLELLRTKSATRPSANWSPLLQRHAAGADK